VPFALVMDGAPKAWAAKNVVYRYGVHHEMKQASDAKPVARWLLQHGFDIAGMSLRKQEIEVITDDRGLELLAKNGYVGKVIEPQVDGKAAAAPDQRYLNPTTTAQKIQDLAKQYPALTRVEQVGTSNQNRPVLALLVSTTPGKSDPAADAKPSIVIDG